MLSPQELMRGAGIDPNEFIGMAVGSSAAEGYVGPYVSLHEEQLEQFIRLVIQETVMIEDATVSVIRGPGQDLANINIPRGQVAGGLGPMEVIDDVVATEAEVVFGGRQVIPKPFELRFKYEQTVLPQINIEEGGLERTVDTMMRTYLANEMEFICVSSRTSGIPHSTWGIYNTGNMTTIDGWYGKALTGAHIYNPDPTGAVPAYVSPEILKNMLELLPTKWRSTNKDDYVFYCSQKFQDEYRDFVSRRGTGLGDVMLEQERVPKFDGIPLKVVPVIPNDARFVGNIRPDTADTEVAGTGTTSGTDQEYSWQIDGADPYDPGTAAELYTWVLLVEKRNLQLGFGPEMWVKKHPHDSNKFDYYNYWGQWDVNYERIDAVVLAINITPTINPVYGPAYDAICPCP